MKSLFSPLVYNMLCPRPSFTEVIKLSHVSECKVSVVAIGLREYWVRQPALTE